LAAASLYLFCREARVTVSLRCAIGGDVEGVVLGGGIVRKSRLAFGEF